ncbi:MAG: hypothetical protein NZO16_00240 [Deltaproteobacteria bacterium]|nr:hypothetical protein [Deltaproteobacteria bacterium]
MREGKLRIIYLMICLTCIGEQIIFRYKDPSAIMSDPMDSISESRENFNSSSELLKSQDLMIKQRKVEKLRELLLPIKTTFQKLNAGFSSLEQKLKEKLEAPKPLKLRRCDLGKKLPKSKRPTKLINPIFISTRSDLNKANFEVFEIEVLDDGTLANRFFSNFVKTLEIECFPTLLTLKSGDHPQASDSNRSSNKFTGLQALQIILGQ